VKKYFTLLLLIGIANGDHQKSGVSTYLSPGLQLGFNSKGKFFISVQTTFGFFSNSVEAKGMLSPPPVGITLGLRWYKMNEKWERYSFNDLQIWPFIIGVGIGQMRDKDGNKYLRFKTGIGAFGYATYDLCHDLEIAEHNFGIIGTLPYIHGEGYILQSMMDY